MEARDRVLALEKGAGFLSMGNARKVGLDNHGLDRPESTILCAVRGAFPPTRTRVTNDVRTEDARS